MKTPPQRYADAAVQLAIRGEDVTDADRRQLRASSEYASAQRAERRAAKELKEWAVTGIDPETTEVKT